MGVDGKHRGRAGERPPPGSAPDRPSTRLGRPPNAVPSTSRAHWSLPDGPRTSPRPAGRWSATLYEPAVPTLTLPLASKNPLLLRRNATALTRLIRRFGIDIVHARSRAPAWSAWSAASATGRHFVTTFHNAYGSGGALKRWYNSVMARGERVIAIFAVRRRSRRTGLWDRPGPFAHDPARCRSWHL